MKTFKKVLRYAFLALLVLLAMSGVLFTGILPRRPEQDYDNETKTELVEGQESEMTERN